MISLVRTGEPLDRILTTSEAHAHRLDLPFTTGHTSVATCDDAPAARRCGREAAPLSPITPSAASQAVDGRSVSPGSPHSAASQHRERAFRSSTVLFVDFVFMKGVTSRVTYLIRSTAEGSTVAADK